MEVTGGIDARTGRVKCFGDLIDLTQYIIALFASIHIPGLVKRTPADECRMVEVTLDLLDPFRKHILDVGILGVVEAPVRILAPNQITQLVCPI